MQYLLSEGEYSELKRDQSDRIQMSKAKLQALCTLAAQYIPVPHEWSQDKTPRPWGCILGPRDQDPVYCDDCPASEICPNPRKEWSK